MNGILLAVPALLPIVGGTAILASGYEAGDERTYRHLEIVVEGLVLLNSLLVALLIAGRSGMDNGLVLFKLYGNLTVRFKLDRMGSVFAGLVAFLWPLATLYSFEYMRHEKRRASFFAYYLMTYGVTIGIAFSGNLVTMYLFYHVVEGPE